MEIFEHISTHSLVITHITYFHCNLETTHRPSGIIIRDQISGVFVPKKKLNSGRNILIHKIISSGRRILTHSTFATLETM